MENLHSGIQAAETFCIAFFENVRIYSPTLPGVPRNLVIGAPPSGYIKRASIPILMSAYSKVKLSTLYLITNSPDTIDNIQHISSFYNVSFPNHQDPGGHISTTSRTVRCHFHSLHSAMVSNLRNLALSTANLSKALTTKHLKQSTLMMRSLSLPSTKPQRKMLILPYKPLARHLTANGSR